MKKLLAIGAFFTAAWCSAVSAQWVSADVNPKSVGTIHVYLQDDAKGGCWTNLRERCANMLKKNYGSLVILHRQKKILLECD